MRGLAILLVAALLARPALALDAPAQPRWPSDRLLGGYDIAALQRGFLVYQTVCASCHSLNALHYRDLEGIGFDTAQVAALASAVKTPQGPATADDRFKNPYPDAQAAARAFGGAVPPDLSTIAAGHRRGARYIYDVLTGYAAPPADITLLPAHFYDPAFPGGQIAMPAPLKDHQVAYADGTNPSTAQEASDVAAFLSWAADPNLDARKQIGLRALLFLLFLAGLAIATKRRIWREAE